MIRLTIILINIVWLWKLISCQACPSGDIKQNDKKIYFLSNEQVDANTAQRACSLLDGSLVSFADSQVERIVMNYIEAKYLSGLQSVWGFYNTNYKNTRYDFSSSLPGWQRWSELGKFKLYSRATKDYNQKYVFCTDQRLTRGTLVARSVTNCSKSSSKISMTLFGGNEQTASTIPLYNWKNDNDASRLSRRDYPFDNFVGIPLQLNNFIRRQSPVYLPDIHVFIGAHSDINQTQWFWGDQRIATNARFPAAYSNTCQQIAMRYFYNDTSEQWINTAQSCNNTKAYFACKTIVKFLVNVTPVECDENSLNVSWKVNDELLKSQNHWTIQIDLDNTSYTAVNFSHKTHLIYGLEQNTEYIVQVTLKGNGCFSFNDSQTIKSRTGLRKPEPGPVQEARVRNSTKNTSTTACVVEWKHSEYDLYKQSHLRYQISLMVSSSMLLNISQVNLDKIGDKFLHAVNLENFISSYPITFQIAAKSCQGISSFVNASGECFPSLKHKPFTTNANSQNLLVSLFTILIIILSGVIAILIGILLYCQYMRKKYTLHIRKTASTGVIFMDENQEDLPKKNVLNFSPDSATSYVNFNTLHESISPNDAKKNQDHIGYENTYKTSVEAADRAYEMI